MKKQFRVKKNQDFQDIIGNKCYITSKEFVIYYKKNQQKHMKVGISVSKKIGNAVIRNKIKRQVREMMRELFIPSLSYDVIVIVRKKYLENDFHANKSSLNKLFNRINFM